MKPKQIIYIYTLLGLLAISACKKDSLLNQAPPTSLTEASYWHTPSDLQNYMNTLYQQNYIFPRYNDYSSLGIYSVDDNSDNMVPQNPDKRLTGQITVAGTSDYAVTNPVTKTASTYADWGNIRTVNYFLANYSKVTGAAGDIAPFVGEAYFFRAMLYFNAVQSFGGVPFINKPLNVDDKEFLNATRLPRNVVVDSILNDLNRAITNLPAKGSPKAQSQRLYKEYAQGFKARVCLFEGTWEKYHAGDAFGVSGQNGANYLQMAADAANAVIS